MILASARRRLRRVVLPAVTLAVAAALVSGCKSQVVASSQSAAPPASAATQTAADPGSASAASATSAASQPTGTGSVAVSITSPVTLSGSTAAPVSCATGQGYHASVTSAVIHGDQVSFSVAIARYRGPGSYPAVVAVTLRQATGVVTSIAGVSRVPAEISATGGSFSVSAAGSGGRTFAGSLTWTCGG